MKRTELYNHIRNEIVNELTVVTKSTTSDEINDIAKSEKTPTTTVKKAIDTAKSTGKDVNIAEMARTPNNIKLGDPSKVELIKKLYSGTWKGNMLDVVEKAGEDGISQAELALAVGKKSQPAINPSVSEFLKVGAFALVNKSSSKDGEKIAATSDEEEWMADADVQDDWEKVDDEEDLMDKGPSTSDIKAADKQAKKVVGGKGNAKQLSPEDEEKYERLKKGIETKISKIKAIQKSKRASSNDMQVLKVLTKRDDVKKLFKAKGVSLTDLIADLIA
jgi:hypothetical protein